MRTIQKLYLSFGLMEINNNKKTGAKDVRFYTRCVSL